MNLVQQIQDFWLQLLEVARHIGPAEVVDVAVVTFILYQLLRPGHITDKESEPAEVVPAKR